MTVWSAPNRAEGLALEHPNIVRMHDNSRFWNIYLPFSNPCLALCGPSKYDIIIRAVGQAMDNSFSSGVLSP